MKRSLLLAIMLVVPLIQTQALTIGVMSNNPPLSSLVDKNNHFAGFEIDLMQDICQRINLPCIFKPVVMKQIQPDLMTETIDLAIASYIIPDKVVPGFIFSLPYLTSNAEFIVDKSSRISTPADIQNKTVGVRHGTLFDDLLIKLYGNKVTITKFMTIDELVYALDNRNIDAALIDGVAADYWLLNGGGEYRTIGNKIPIGNGYGILANVGQTALIAKINQALQNMMIDGSYVKIYSAYF